jgi:hypothetical protein
MNKLTYHDLQFALLRTPKPLLELMKRPEWAGKIFVGGGFLRSIVAGDPINDIDVFVGSNRDAETLGILLADEYECKLWRTDNALTVTGAKPAIQIIHRWTFKTGFEAADSFDFTCCCAMFWWGTKEITEGGEVGWQSYCDERFYCDVAGKRLIYRNPARNEDAGGSMLRVLKYYQKGYRIPLDSLADVITRLVQGVDFGKLMPDMNSQAEMNLAAKSAPERFSNIICGLLREVDPAVDPNHVAHLPAENTRGTPGEGQ